jgi:hypothetical protein
MQLLEATCFLAIERVTPIATPLTSLILSKAKGPLEDC